MSNTQATSLAPPHSPNHVIVIVIVIVTGKPTLNCFLQPEPDFRYTDFLAGPNPILGTQTFWRTRKTEKTEKPKNRKHNENRLKIYGKHTENTLNTPIFFLRAARETQHFYEEHTKTHTENTLTHTHQNTHQKHTKNTPTHTLKTH